MKRILFVVAVLLSVGSMAQNKATANYPVLANANLAGKNAEGSATTLVKNDAVIFNITLLNINQAEPVKAGSCYVHIAFGKNIKLTQKNLRYSLPLSKYFNWSAKEEEAGTELTGKLITDLPGDFTETVSFDLVSTETGSSTIKAELVMPTERIKTGSLNTLDYTVAKKRVKD